MTRQRILLIVLLAWALAMIVPDVLRVVQPLGSFADNDGVIYDVTGPFDAESAPPPGRPAFTTATSSLSASFVAFPTAPPAAPTP